MFLQVNRLAGDLLFFIGSLVTHSLSPSLSFPPVPPRLSTFCPSISLRSIQFVCVRVKWIDAFFFVEKTMVCVFGPIQLTQASLMGNHFMHSPSKRPHFSIQTLQLMTGKLVHHLFYFISFDWTIERRAQKTHRFKDSVFMDIFTVMDQSSFPEMFVYLWLGYRIKWEKGKW